MINKYTNDEIIDICEEMRKKHSDVDWGFEVKQTSSKIYIFWGYIKYIGIMNEDEAWTINKRSQVVRNEKNDLMNYYLECDIEDLKSIIESCVYYMVTRY